MTLRNKRSEEALQAGFEVADTGGCSMLRHGDGGRSALRLRPERPGATCAERIFSRPALRVQTIERLAHAAQCVRAYRRSPLLRRRAQPKELSVCRMRECFRCSLLWAKLLVIDTVKLNNCILSILQFLVNALSL